MEVADTDPAIVAFSKLSAIVDTNTGPATGTRTQTGTEIKPPAWQSDYDMSMGGRRRRHGGANRCSKYFKFLLKGVVMVAGGAIVYYSSGTGGIVGLESAKAALSKINEFCTVGPMSATPVQAAVCGLVYKLQNELVQFFATQDYGTIKAMLTGGVAVVGSWSLWNALKGAISGSNDLLNTMIDDFCEHFFANPTTVAVAVQTEADKAGASVPEVNAGVQKSETTAAKVKGPMDAFVKKGKGGRKHRSSKRTMKKKRVAKKSTRKMSFRY